jgi:hypothetical protein
VNSILVPEKTPSPSPVAGRFIPYLLIFVAALAYYGSYWHFWFNPHDESGTAVLIAQRLMHGEKPWVDFEPGYNIGWFYPLVWIFHFTGVNFLAARAWFFTLSLITAVLGCGIVSRVTGSGWAGLFTGLLLVAFPGSQFKNYIPLAEAANTACLIHLLHVDPKNRRKWFGAAMFGGIVLGLTFLVRVEIAYFFTAIWLLLLLVSLFDRRLPLAGRFGGLGAGLIGIVLGVIVAQTPAYTNFQARGLGPQFIAEYTSWLGFLRASLHQRLDHEKKPAAPATTTAVQAEAGVTPTVSLDTPTAETGDRSALPRKPISALLQKGRWNRALAFLTYAPLIGFAIFFIAGVLGFVLFVLQREFLLSSAPMHWLILIGGSLTTFPQYFFFRPDRPHISEFMPGYIIAMVASAWLLWPRGPVRPLALRALAALVSLFLLGHFALFAAFALHHPSAGTIVARLGRHVHFQAQNGVRVHLSKKEAATLQPIYDVVMKSTRPQDYVICFPYMPGYNVMTNRRTYLRNIYVDNATRGEKWAENTIQDFEQKHPGAVIVDDRAINGLPASRFSHWGAPVYKWLKQNYTSAGKFEAVEVFLPPAPEPAPAAAPAPTPTTEPAAPTLPTPSPSPATPAPPTPAPFSGNAKP